MRHIEFHLWLLAMNVMGRLFGSAGIRSRLYRYCYERAGSPRYWFEQEGE
jgi:hypothetical protein